MLVVLDILAVPYNFLSGFFLGLIAPLAAIAAVVAGIRLLTGQVPFLGEIAEGEAGGRQLSFKLVPPDQARQLFETQKAQIGGDLGRMRAELQAIIEEAKADATAEATKKGEAP
jgi:hypothetical protein